MSPEERFWSKVDRRDTCWLWTGAVRRNGYGHCYFSLERRNTFPHRVAWELTYGPIPHGMLVCHICDVRHCVRPEHLFLGTHADNTRDMMAKGRDLFGQPPGAKGEAQWKAKLTEKAVRDIRRRAAAGSRQADLAREYGVSTPTICDVVKRKSWAHVS